MLTSWENTTTSIGRVSDWVCRKRLGDQGRRRYGCEGREVEQRRNWAAVVLARLTSFLTISLELSQLPLGRVTRPLWSSLG